MALTNEQLDLSLEDEGDRLYKKKWLGIEINGSLFADDKEIDIDEAKFFKEFIEFIESRGWSFGGGISQVDEDGEYID